MEKAKKMKLPKRQKGRSRLAFYGIKEMRSIMRKNLKVPYRFGNNYIRIII